MKLLTATIEVSLALLLGFLNSCSPLQQAIQQQMNLTPEQIQALDAAGQSVVACLQGGGPPGAGSLVLMVVPKTAAGAIKFGPDCHPDGTVTLTPSTYKAVP